MLNPDNLKPYHKIITSIFLATLDLGTSSILEIAQASTRIENALIELCGGLDALTDIIDMQTSDVDEIVK